MRLNQTLLLLAGVALVPSPAWAVDPKPGSSVSVHGGWFDVGGEFQTPWGVFGGLGVPWVAYVPRVSGQEGIVSADARLGYSYSLTEHVSLRALILSGWFHRWGDPCSEGCTTYEHWFFNFLAAGVRYHFSSGVLVGLEVPLVGVETHHSSEPGDSGWRAPDWYPPPYSAAFTQAYVGYGWQL